MVRTPAVLAPERALACFRSPGGGAPADGEVPRRGRAPSARPGHGAVPSPIATNAAAARRSHAAAARHLLGDACERVGAVLADVASAPVSGKLKAPLAIAAQVRRGGRIVADEDVAAARAEGATDRDLHDTVLIAAVFCMADRYVDGLAARAPDDPALHARAGAFRAAHGYLAPASTARPARRPA